MANNRELSQVAGFIIVDDTSRNIGIATTATPYVGIGTTNPQAKLQVVGDVILDQVKITTAGVVTSSNPGVSTVVYWGDGSNLIGVNAFNVINQDLTSSPVYPTFANNTGVTSIGISTNKIVFVPDPGNLGIGTTNPSSTLQVGAAITMYGPTGIVSATAFYGDGTNLTGVNAFNVIQQDLTSSPVFPTFANSTGVTSIGISTSSIVFIPATGRLGIGTTNPLSSLQVGTAITMYGSTGIVSAFKFFGDGSGLSGVSAFNVIPQDLTSSPVYPTFANNTGVSSVGIATTGFVFIPTTGNVGLGSTQPAYKIDAVGDINITGTYRVGGRSVLDDALIYSIVFG